MEQEPVSLLEHDKESAILTDRALRAQIRYHTDKIQALYLLLHENNERLDILHAPTDLETTS